jgi:prepilin-type N-terminal cleavage/methylation domain-containing protein/prepilin-type processing-associated H-X9-DG protein
MRAASMRSGFTLIELLVVVAVIGILAALTMPVILSSMASSIRTQCASNLKQIGYGMAMYSANNGVFILPAFMTWPDAYLTHAPGFTAGWHGVGREGGLWPAYVRDPRVFICPGNTGWMPSNNISYGHNWAPWNGIPNVCLPARMLQDVGDPTGTIIALDANNVVLWDWLGPDPDFTNTPNSLIERIMERHGKGQYKGPNCLYMDGHADFRRRLLMKKGEFTPKGGD